MKKAQSHVEIIVSFVIFIGFLLFIFIFLNPFAKSKEPSYIIDNIQRVVIDEITAEIGKLSIVTNRSGGCYEIPIYLTSEYGTNFKEIKNDEKKYTIYFSNDVLSGGSISCSGDSLNYTLGTYSKEKLVVYEKIGGLEENYNSDYDLLKKSLGITNDFSFNVENMLGEELISVSRNIPTGIDVEAREIPIRTINSNGQIQELILNIRAW